MIIFVGIMNEEPPGHKIPEEDAKRTLWKKSINPLLIFGAIEEREGSHGGTAPPKNIANTKPPQEC